MIEPDATEASQQNSDEGQSLTPRIPPFLDYFEESIRPNLYRRWWLHFLLFFATFFTTTVFGFALLQSFAGGHGFNADWVVDGYIRLAHGNRRIFTGVWFSLPLLTILLAHETGHNVAARRAKIDASLPYFLPSPSLFGTLGAFIRIRSPIYSRKKLFDIGVSGPMAGFAVLLPFLIGGLVLSRVVTGAADQGTFTFGTPLLLRWAEYIRFPGVPASSICLHPMAMAAWVGLFSTAINLLPIGQLDGGHILYAALGERWHRFTSNALVGVLLVAGFFYWGWWLWAVLLFFFGRRHPLIYDVTPLDRPRLLLSVGALLLFIVAVSIVPVSAR